MTDIHNRSLYRQATVKDYACTVKVVHPGIRVYDRNRQRIVITTEKDCFLVTGPAGEREVYNEEDFMAGFDFPKDEKSRKKLMKGKLYKIKARAGTGKLWYLRVPSHERFTVYTLSGAVIQGNVSDYSVDHANGDCAICPVGMDGGPDMAKMTVMNGKVFCERYGSL